MITTRFKQSNKAVTLFIFGVALFYATTISAHPLGNNTVNRQAGLQLHAKSIELRYLMDVAEIPTLSETMAADGNQDGATSSAEWDSHARNWANEMMPHLMLELNKQRLPLQFESQRWSLQDGAAGLAILRLEARFGAPVDGQGKVASLRYEDRYKPEQLGWKEIWISAADDVKIVATTAARIDRSLALTDFTLAPGAHIPNELSAAAEIIFPAEKSTHSQSGTLEPTPILPGQTSPAGSTSGTQQAWSFFKLGIHHIAVGLDHLMFLLGLLLLRQSVRGLIKIVTAFTLAHSLTLALAATGMVTPPGSWIEPAIALTIAYVGLLSLLWRQHRHTLWLAFGFGLVHGFGFAGALAESLGGQVARRGNWLINLASFNLGIEVFQVALVCLVVPVLLLAARFSWYRWVQAGLSGVVLVSGLSWFFTRTLGIL